MKSLRVALFGVLALAVVLLFVKIGNYQEVITENKERMDVMHENFVNAELELHEKNEYIKTLHLSVESLNSDLLTLENKLNELAVYKDKLK